MSLPLRALFEPTISTHDSRVSHSQRTLDRHKLRDVAQMAGYAEIFTVC
jgi:hypothetical protein